jgi:DNA-3-methyladenine glycosylase
MTTRQRLPRDFFARDSLTVARELLGARLVHIEDGVRISGIITETEAYCGETDLGCHAKAGRTPRTAVMYGPPGFAYVYFTYGMHWLFNAVTMPEGQPEAVLIRAIEPVEGVEIIAKRRHKQPQKLWANGPAKLTQALGIDGQHNNLDLCGAESEIFIERDHAFLDGQVVTGPRVGLETVPEPWKSKPWRFLVTEPGVK